MKKIFITVLCAGLFVMVSTAWASGENEKAKAPAKVETAAKKVEAPQKAATASCCAESCPMKAADAKACCSEEKKADAKAPAKTEKAAKETKSSGKK